MKNLSIQNIVLVDAELSRMFERALSAINLEDTDRIPFWPWNFDPKFAKRTVGYDLERQQRKATIAMVQHLDADFAFIPDPVADKETDRIREKVKDGETVYEVCTQTCIGTGRRSAGSVWKGMKVARTKLGSGVSTWIVDRPFKTLEELEIFLADYDPCEEIEASTEELAEEFQSMHKTAQDSIKDCAIVPQMYYLTLFQNPLMKIGWPLLARLIYQRPHLWKRLLERFVQYSIKITTAWSMTDIRLFFSHDDLATYNGPVMPPSWFKENIISNYKRIWAPLQKRGIKVMFVSDGNYMPLADEIAKYADGFWFERSIDAKEMGEKHGYDKFFMGLPDVNWGQHMKTRTVSFIKRCIADAGRYPGYIMPIYGWGLGADRSELLYKTYVKYAKRCRRDSIQMASNPP